MGISLLPDLGTESTALNKERQEVHCAQLTCLREVLLSRHEASLRSVLTPPCQCQGQGHDQAKVMQLLLGTFSSCPDYPATLKHSLCQRLWKVQILPFRLYGWFPCLWSSVPTEDEGKFPVILMRLGLSLSLFFAVVISFVAVDLFLY